MKNIFKYFFFLGLFTLASCSLDTEPLVGRNDVSFYKTPEDAYTALVGCYDGLQVATGGIGGLGFPVASEVMSDNCFGGVGNSDGFGFQAVDEFDITRSPSDVNLLNPNWESYYAAITRCNILLSKMGQIDWSGKASLKNQYESESKFIRAYLYFEMVRLWGNIPLLTNPSTEVNPQANPVDVYKLIAQDLVFAADNLENSKYNAVPSGRITKWAAKSLLARVYLYYTGYYAKPDLEGLVTKAQALQHLEDVIAASGHDLLEDFSTLWPAASVTKYAGENNKENVFSIKFTHTSDYNGNTDGNHWMVMFGMREFTSTPYGNGWGITVNPKLWNEYNKNDTRQVATMIGIKEEKILFDKVPNQREYTGYYNKKYSPMSDAAGNSVVNALGGTNFQIGQFQDYTVIRYADVLLMAAELGSSNAQMYFDKVRQRAYKANFTALNVTPTNILKERHLEFALEGIRYWDLLRQGITVASSTIAETTSLLNGGVPTNKVISANNITKTKGLQQIPKTQIDLSGGVLKQNAGW